ncbi:MAG: hypothetical protein OEN55_17745 [Alphaproteobacteria bacterium]|nr:hypothetical protein [Alphaproteobacteria bacterium]
MHTEEAEIRRHANGSIDIGYYVNMSHRMRSLRAHRMIGRFAGLARTLVRALFARERGEGTGQVGPTSRQKSRTPEQRKELHKAA